MMHRVNFDGGFTANTVSYGYIIYDPAGAEVTKGGEKFQEKGSTNVVAEYMGLIIALQKSLSLGIKRLKVYGDSQTVIHQLNGLYKIRDNNCRPLFYVVKHLIGQFEVVELHWVPREQNREADRAAKV
jgi:ribonuclease HI